MPPSTAQSRHGPRYSLWQLVRYMLGLGAWGFGGPVALVGYMYRDLVEKRGWITESDYKEGLALAQLMPGPLAAQLSIYLGFVHYRVRRRHAGRRRLRAAFVPHGRRPGRALRGLWRHRLDAGCVLRRRRSGDRHHRAERLQAHHAETSAGTSCCGRSSWSVPQSRSSPSPRSSGSSLAAACWSGCRAHRRSPSRGRMNAMGGPLAASLSLGAVDWHKLGQIGALLRLRRQLRLRQRPGDRAVPLWRRRQGIRAG